jgi:hypothetical protein
LFFKEFCEFNIGLAPGVPTVGYTLPGDFFGICCCCISICK